MVTACNDAGVVHDGTQKGSWALDVRCALLSRWKKDGDAKTALGAVRKRDLASEAADQTAGNCEPETGALNAPAV